MKKFSKYVGLDVHKETIAVAVAEADGGEVRFFGEIVNTTEAIQKLVGQLSKAGAQLSFCYEAGPCGYVVQRHLRQLGWDCQVVAPCWRTHRGMGAGRRIGSATRSDPSSRGYKAPTVTVQAKVAGVLFAPRQALHRQV